MSKPIACLSFCISLLLLTLAAPVSHAVIPAGEDIQADIAHSFIVGNTTLPPGKYHFRILQGSDLNAMRVASADGSTSVEFLVRPSIDNHRPTHTELVFIRYGKTEILKAVYVGGSKNGVAVIDPSREEARLQKQGQKPNTHTEQESH